MVRRIETWEAGDGTTHSSKIVALAHEIRVSLVGMSGNEAIGTKMAAALDAESASSLSELLAEYAHELGQH